MYHIDTIGSLGDVNPLDAWKNALPGLALDPSWVPGAVVNPDGSVTPPAGYNGPPLVPVLPPIPGPAAAPTPVWKKPEAIGLAVVGTVALLYLWSRFA